MKTVSKQSFDASIAVYMTQIGERARAAAHVVGQAGSAQKDAALHAIAQSIHEQSQAILAANSEDLKAGASTDKLHARGPVGLEGLTSQKFIVIGDGQVRK